MAHGSARLLACGVAVLVGSGCLSSNYTPRTPGRVATLMQNNKVVYVRDGRIYQQGFFGGGLRDVVQGVPEAERAADSFVGRRRSGFLIAIGGTVCAAVALGFMTAHATADGDHSDAVLTEGLIGGGCALGAYLGLWRIISAEPYKYDAINIFNDNAPSPSQQRPSSPWDAP